MLTRSRTSLVVAVVVAATFGVGVVSAAASPGTFVGPLTHNTTVASTVPGNSDVNPYGVAVVPVSRGKLVAGDVLVSNFNNAPTAAAPGGRRAPAPPWCRCPRAARRRCSRASRPRPSPAVSG